MLSGYGTPSPTQPSPSASLGQFSPPYVGRGRSKQFATPPSASTEMSHPLLGTGTGTVRRIELPVRSPGAFAVNIILLNEFCERLAFYSIVSNLVVFLGSRLDFGATEANTVALIFSGCCYITPILGGWVADEHYGRFHTILGFLGVYVVGLIILTVSAVEELTTKTGVYLALAILAVGAGGIKANVSPFGADQLSEHDAARERRFFGTYYLMINVGAVLAQVGVAYVQQEVNFWCGYLIPTGVMILCTLIYVLSRKQFVQEDPGGSVVVKACKVMHATSWCCCCACVPCCRRRPPGSSRMTLRTEDTGDSWLDSVKGQYESEIVDNVKQVGSVLPVLASFCFFWTVQTEINTIFISQGILLKLRLGSIQVPVAALGSADSAGIVVFILLVEYVIYPWLASRGIVISEAKRIVFGFFCALLGALAAGILEMVRLGLIHSGDTLHQSVGGKVVVAANLSVLWQIPQYALIGLSEVFAVTTVLKVAYAHSPRTMRSLIMAIYLFTTAVGSFVGAALVQAASAWVPQNLNHGHVDYYFYCLAGAMVLNIGYFVWAYSRFKPAARGPIASTKTVQQLGDPV